jgi:SpoVK/Ycf46/Vps4 family AAA+-type ATPase
MDSVQTLGLEDISERLTRAVAVIAGRLARLLAQIPGQSDGLLLQSQKFLRASYEATGQSVPLESRGAGLLERSEADPPQAIDLLLDHFQLSSVEVELLLLAAMPEEHEGYSAVLRSLHPKGESHATVGLAAQLLFAENGGRRHCRQLVEEGGLFRNGIVSLSDGDPFFDRSLLLADTLWSALHGVDTTPAALAALDTGNYRAGLERWLASTSAKRALRALRARESCTIAVTAEDASAAFHRAVSLVMHAGRKVAGFGAATGSDPDWRTTLRIHATLRDEVPVLRLADLDPTMAMGQNSLLDDWPGPLVISGTGVSSALGRNQALISVPVEPLDFVDRRSMWSELIPALAGSAEELAARYPLEPFRVMEVARDLQLVEAVEKRLPTVSDVAQVLRARGRRSLSAGVRVVRPRADWVDLVLPSQLTEQLHEAVDRLKLQSCVLDDWGFLKHRVGTRGVRLLFAGPPGTGKTLSAEVLAHAFDTDLMIVDVSRVVSKWVGETEKNLAAIFDAAENSQAVLLFDEADALFAKRTEVSDAHDRYANLETAYLLQRLERFDGLVIMATNLRQNIDAAFVRRLEFVLDFSEPDREQRVALWKRHIPADAPLDPELNFHELAALYPVVGGVIRNAAVAAAFRAAANGGRLGRNHFVHAIQREYEKAGRAFPGFPAGMRN